MNKKIKLLEEIVKNSPALIGSITLTPIAFPYTLLGSLINSLASPVDGYTVDCLYNFFENDKFLRVWRYGFNKISQAIRKYKMK